MISHKKMGGRLAAGLLLLGAAVAAAGATEPLSLDEALRRALSGNPELAASELAGRSQSALVGQALARPNPELEVEWENLAGTGELQGTGSSELLLSVSQLLETGGKRRWRGELARGEADLQGWEHRILGLDLRLRVKEAFVMAWLAQEELALARENRALGDQLVRELESRVSAGASSRIEVSRAEVGVARAELEIREAERRWRSTARELAACWGGSEPDFSAVTLKVDTLAVESQTLADEASLAQNPEVARWRRAEQVAAARRNLARAEGKPDLNLSLGVKHDFDLDDRALVVGAGLPLPIFDRNAGAVRAAEHEIANHRLLAENAALAVRTALALESEELKAAAEEILFLSTRIIPLATRTQQDTRQGHQSGLFSLTDVLATRQSMFELRREHLVAVARFKIAQARIERLRGGVSAADPHSIEPAEERP